ncbi:Hachiman antiphage defense system protein HamA [Psychrobacter sp. JB385]|uniref:HamA C-terminal domain-containing protein n=1 Tax=Psychrobacter sp. JB385 TaxID=1434841 RepID=UPI00097ECCAB|nr:Hachiman antiphage defense system protein HamA [Psychrobacter sp. JB385]SJN43670.1 hypothetical protein CZ794_13080 [Psychrobacter sp. JB385]
MSEQQLNEEYKLDSIHIIESWFEADEGRVSKRGTCFSISKNLLLTAYHVIRGSTDLRIYTSSDSYVEEEYIITNCTYFNEQYDIAILEISDEPLNNFITLYSTSVGLNSDVKVCGYPVEKEHYHAPMNAKITNNYENVDNREYSFEISQSNTVSKYGGMSGSPIIYNNSCIGILRIQQGNNTLYTTSIKDLLNDPLLLNIFQEHQIDVSIQEGIDYQPPEHPKSPFKYCIDCNAEYPNIKGVDIGFTFREWNINSFTETVHDWIIDYCLTLKEQINFSGSDWGLFKHARLNYPKDDLNALGDLCLHIAIRESCKTIPIINKIFDMNNKIFSCTHAVLNFDSLELWLGASSVSANIEDGIQSAITSIRYIREVQSLKNRLFMLNAKIDESWPHKDKLRRLSDSSLKLEERFDKIIIPVFIMHNSELVADYDKEKFLNLFNEHVQTCRGLLKNGLNKDPIEFIDLRVFYFPVSDIKVLNDALLEELY